MSIQKIALPQALYWISAALCTVVLCCASAPSAQARMINYQNQSDALGQTDGDTTAPAAIFTKGTAHDAPNKIGLNAPVIGIEMDTVGHRLFLSDTSNNRVLIYNLDSSNNLIDRIPDNVLGQVNFYTNAVGTTQIGMSAPNGLTYDSTNKRLFVVDTTNNRVKVYDATSITDGENAVNVLGQTTFTTATAATSQEGLNNPMGVNYDSTGNRLFVAQGTGNRVTVFDVSAIADGEAATGVLGQTDFVTATAATTQVGMNIPEDLALSGTTLATLFVSQTGGSRVTTYYIGDGITNGENAVHVLGQTNFTNTAAATTQVGMNAPRGIAYDSTTKKLYVSQLSGNRVTIFDAGGITDGANAVNVLGQTNFTNTAVGLTQGGFSAPTGVYIDKVNQRLYVPQSGYSRVSIFSVSGMSDGQNAADALGQYDNSLSAPGPIYTKGTSQNGPSRIGLVAPLAVAIDGTNHRLFVADSTNNRVLVYGLTSANLLSDRIPDNVIGQANFYSNAAATTQTGLSAPAGLAVDGAGNRLFVSDMTNSRVLVFSTASITDGENAANVLGQLNYTTATATVTQIGMNVPRQIAYDSASNQLFVADVSNSRVSVFNVATVVDGAPATDMIGQDDGTVSAPQPIYTKSAIHNGPHKLGLSAPVMGLVMDTVGHRLFVSDTVNNRVLEYDLDGSNALLDRTPDHVLGQTNFYTSAAASTRNGFQVPNGLEFDSNTQRLFVAQTTGDRVSVFDVTAITDGEDAVNMIGQINFTTITAATTQIGLNVPTGVTFGGSGSRLYVAQNTGNRVSVFDLSQHFADFMSANNEIGQTDDNLTSPGPIFTKTAANNGPNKLGINAPVIGVTMDTVDHRLFLSDTVNNRVLVYNLDSSNALIDRIPDNVLGQANFYTSTAAATQVGMNVPNGLTYDSTNKRLFVADTTNNRVKVYDTTTITDGESAFHVLGQVSFVAATAATTQVGMNVPTGVTYGGSGSRLYVAQNSGNRVTVYDVAGITDGENAINVLGQTSFTNTAAASTQAGMNVPFDVALSGSALTTLFVSQGSGNRVTTYDVTSVTDGENAVHVLGQSNFTNTSPASTQVGLNVPRGISYDPVTKTLYVAQTNGNRVTTYNGASISDGANAVNELGQAAGVNAFTTAFIAVTQAAIFTPTGVYIDSANARLYVPQSGANRVSIFDVSSISDGQNASDLLGQYDDSLSAPGPIYATKSTANNTPSKLGLSAGVIGLALDPTDHRLFVSDTVNNRVLEYDLDANDQLLDLIADHVLGQANFYSNGVATTQVGMNAPNGITYDDPNNLLYVAQAGNHRVTVYDVTSITDGESATHVLGQPTFTASTAATSAAGMNVPTGLAYGGSGSRLYVAQNSANRVTAYNVADGITDGENAVAVLGQTNFTNTTAATTQVGMNVPFALALSGSVNTTLFVSQGSGNRVTSYDVTKITDGENAVNVLGQTTFTATAAASTQVGMNVPRGVSYDPTNKRLYVAQTSGARVTTYKLSDGITDGENAQNEIGQSSFTTAVASVSMEGLSAPTGVLADPTHNRVYVMDSTTNRVLTYNTNTGIGTGMNAVAVLGQADFVTATAATTQAGMNVPFDVALSGTTLATTLFVSQSAGNRVTSYDVSNIVNGENAVQVLGQTNFTNTTAATTQAGMNAPRGLEYDATTKTLYVAQTSGARVTTYDVAAITDGENAIHVLGQPNFITTAASTRQAGLNAPNGTYLDVANQKLYVLQSGASRVSLFNVTSITDGEDASDLIGQSDDAINPPGAIYTKGTANNGPYKLGLNLPQGVAVDGANHRLFVADTANNRILVYNLTAGNLTTDHVPDNVLGQSNFYSNAVATTQTGVSSPVGLAFDAGNNRLFASDLTNNRVLVYDTASISDGENAAFVLGQPSFVLATAGTTQYGLSAPRVPAYDTVSAQLFVPDSTNNRAVIYNFADAAATSSGGGDEFHFFGF